MDIWISIAVTFLLVLINGYFSLAETALINAKLLILQREAEEGDRRAARAHRLADEPSKFLPTVQVAVTLVGFFASAVAAVTLSAPFAAWLSHFNVGWLSATASVLAPVLITLAVSYLSIVIGELLPKRIALANTEGVSKRVAGSLAAFSRVMIPFVALASVLACGLAKLFHIKDTQERQNLSEEEIKCMVEDNNELHENEKRMIHDILDLSDMSVHEIMQPRVDMILVEDTETVYQALERMRGTGYSRLPVYHEDVDCIAGIVHYKDLMGPFMDGKGDDPVASYIYQTMFVPETKDIYPLLTEMQANRQQMAIVVDEYGGTDGLITIEDIVEEIVGEILDESDRENPFIEQVNEDCWVVDGRFSVEDAKELGWPVEESSDYETMAGWLMSAIDSVPQTGDEFDFEGYRFQIQSMRRRRILRVRVECFDASKKDDSSS